MPVLLLMLLSHHWPEAALLALVSRLVAAAANSL
jgi:hypothetical protein